MLTATEHCTFSALIRSHCVMSSLYIEYKSKYLYLHDMTVNKLTYK